MKIESGKFNIIKGVEPKYKSKNKLIQKILIKLFGYKIVTEKKKCTRIETKTEDCFKWFDGRLEIDMNKIE